MISRQLIQWWRFKNVTLKLHSIKRIQFIISSLKSLWVSAIRSLIYQDIVGELERSLIKLTNTITKEITEASQKNNKYHKRPLTKCKRGKPIQTRITYDTRLKISLPIFHFCTFRFQQGMLNKHFWYSLITLFLC